MGVSLIRVVKAPPIRFTCTSCRAENEGDPEDLEERHTMPPSYAATCAFCRARVTCYPTALIARTVGRMVGA